MLACRHLGVVLMQLRRMMLGQSLCVLLMLLLLLAVVVVMMSSHGPHSMKMQGNVAQMVLGIYLTGKAAGTWLQHVRFMISCCMCGHGRADVDL